MRRSVPLLAATLAAAPLAVSSPDSSVTELRVAGGRGSYAYITRGCSNEVLTREKINYDNVAAEASHKFAWPVRVGARAGQLSPNGVGDPYQPDTTQLEVRYINPYLSFELPGVSLSAGYVHADHAFPEQGFSRTWSGHVRMGTGTYMELSRFEGVPLLTTGFSVLGVGFQLPRADLSVGIGKVPQDKLGLVSRAEYRFADRLGVGGTLRLGTSEGVSENAFALSLSYRFTHRRR